MDRLWWADGVHGRRAMHAPPRAPVHLPLPPHPRLHRSCNGVSVLCLRVDFGSKASTEFSIQEQLPYLNVPRFKGGLESKARRVLYRSTLGLRVINKKGVDFGSQASTERYESTQPPVR